MKELISFKVISGIIICYHSQTKREMLAEEFQIENLLKLSFENYLKTSFLIYRTLHLNVMLKE